MKRNHLACICVVLCIILSGCYGQPEPDIKLWRTITLGTYKDVAMLREALGVRGSPDDVLGKVDLASEESTVDLVVLSVEELGFPNEARYDQICARAKQLGLDLCPAEVGPQLRLQYADQPKREFLHIAMEAIPCSIGKLSIFNIGHDSYGFRLGTSSRLPTRVWLDTHRFVFVRRK
jgi:hypothetical protein